MGTSGTSGAWKDPRPTWDEYFLTMAGIVALRGDCTRLQVGAVLVWGQRVWSTGYNGTPLAGDRGCLKGYCPRGQKSFEEAPHYYAGNQDFSDCIAVHAEMNAVKQFNDVAVAAEYYVRSRHWPGHEDRPTMYVSAVPCSMCAVSLGEERINVVARDAQGGVVRATV